MTLVNVDQITSNKYNFHVLEYHCMPMKNNYILASTDGNFKNCTAPQIAEKLNEIFKTHQFIHINNSVFQAKFLALHTNIGYVIPEAPQIFIMGNKILDLPSQRCESCVIV